MLLSTSMSKKWHPISEKSKKKQHEGMPALKNLYMNMNRHLHACMDKIHPQQGSRNIPRTDVTWVLYPQKIYNH
jgi:5'-3' exonuclease